MLQTIEKSIVITGAMGFIGSNLVRYYNEQGLDSLVLVDSFDHPESWKNLLGLRYKQLLTKADAMAYLRAHSDQIAKIVHLGAISDTTCADSSVIMENNYQFSIDLVKLAVGRRIGFLYASSAATYGDGQLGFDDDHSLLHSLKPLNLYGFSKHAFDLWLLENGMIDKVVGVKYFNIFGPGEAHKGRMASMVYHMKHQIEKEGRVRLFASNSESFSDGEQKRDFFYVKDAVKMTAFLLDRGFKGIYNVGSGSASSWNEMATHAFHALGKEVNIDYIPMPRDLEGKYQNFTEAKMTKFHHELSARNLTFTLDYSFQTAIFDYIQNHLLEGRSPLVAH